MTCGPAAAAGPAAGRRTARASRTRSVCTCRASATRRLAAITASQAGSVAVQPDAPAAPGQVVLGRLPVVRAASQGDPGRAYSSTPSRRSASIGRGRGPAHQVRVERTGRRLARGLQPVDPGGDPGQVGRDQARRRHRNGQTTHHMVRAIATVTPAPAPRPAHSGR